MTVTTTGAPDWLRAIPGGNQPLYAALYGLAASPFSLGPFTVSAQRGLAIRWIPDQSQVLTVSWLTAGPSSAVLTQRKLVCLAGTSNVFNLPVMGVGVTLDFALLSGAGNVSGQIFVNGHGGSTDYGAARGVTRLVDVNGTVVAAGGLITLSATTTVEGPAVLTMSMVAAPAAWTVDITAIDPTNTTRRILNSGGVAGAARASVEAALWLPPWPVTVTVSNTDAAGHPARGALIAGG